MSRVPITETIRQQLNELHLSTCVGPQRLLKGRTDRPQKLSSTTIYNWMKGNTKTTQKNHLDFVLEAWRNTDALEMFIDADLLTLDQELVRTG